MLGSAYLCLCAFVLRITQGKTFILSRQHPYEPRFVRKLKFLKEKVTHKAIAQQAICYVFLFSLSNFPVVRWVSGLFSLWHPLSSVDRYPRSKHSIDTWLILDRYSMILNQHSVDISIDSFGFDQGSAYRYISSYARMSTLLTTLSGLASYRQLYRGIFADIIVFIFAHLHTALRAKRKHVWYKLSPGI